jgi:hypothetical protein
MEQEDSRQWCVFLLDDFLMTRKLPKDTASFFPSWHNSNSSLEVSSTIHLHRFPLPSPWSGARANGHYETANESHIPWYPWWVRQQLQNCQDEVFSPLGGLDPQAGYGWHDQFWALWETTSEYIRTQDKPSIDAVVVQLAENKIINLEDHHHDLFKARRLVFAVLGWQTMVYRADTGSYPSGQLGIIDEMDGYQGQGQVLFKQDQSSCVRQLHRFLMGFGVLLPPSQFISHDSPEDKKAFKILKSIEPASFNAFLMHSIGRLRIKWIENICHHMELDKSTNVLYLYKYPSFCRHNIQLADGKHHQSVIHALAAPEMDSNLWATRDEITKMLRETLLTYRLLFGQHKQARRLYRKSCPFDGVLEKGKDSLLDSLCGRKHCCLPSEYQERESYDLAHDFAMYRNRIAAIHRHLSLHKPRTWERTVARQT